jgi:2'-5' RNA ligase
MINFSDYILSEDNKPHKFGCVMAQIPNSLTKELETFNYKKIPEEIIFPEEGRELDSHVTVLYGLHTKNAGLIKKFFKDQKAFSITLGKVSKFESEKYDVIKLDVFSETLIELNTKLREKFEYTSNFNDYKAHLTLAYCLKNKANDIIGDNTFAGTKITVDRLVFSDMDKNKTFIELK